MTTTPEQQLDLDTVVKPQDQWTRELYRNHGLPIPSTLRKIKPIAIELLKELRFLVAAEMVPGRCIKPSELNENRGQNELSLARYLPTSEEQFARLVQARINEQAALLKK
jgi:hypothetical protein